MLTDNFLKNRRRRELSGEERAALESVLSPPVTLPKRKVVTTRGDVISRSTFLISGLCAGTWMVDGHRQLVSVQTPGDFVDLHSYPLQRLDHYIATISECQVAYAPHEKLTELIEQMPHLARVFWFSTLARRRDAPRVDFSARAARRGWPRRAHAVRDICAARRGRAGRKQHLRLWPLT